MAIKHDITVNKIVTQNSSRTATQIALIYFANGVLWITFSDFLLMYMIKDTEFSKLYRKILKKY